MADDDYLDEIEDLEVRGLSQPELAHTLEERARQSRSGSVERSAFLNAAGDHWTYAEEPERAEAAYRSSIASGGDPSRYAEGALALLLLRNDREPEADAIVTSLMQAARADELRPETYEIVGEALEEAGRLRQALRWFTMPLRDVDPDDLDRGDLVLLQCRYRVRRALGLPEDRFDLERDRLV